MKPRSILTIGNFFAIAHFFLIVYLVAPYLATFMPDSAAGLVVSCGAIITLTVFCFMAGLVRTHGSRRLAIFFAFVELFALAWLAVDPTPIAATVLVALALATTPLMTYQLDLLLEATIAREGSTGRIRTLFLTAGNSALVISPLIAGIILASGDSYWRVFALAAATLIPFILIMLFCRLPEGTHPDSRSVLQAWVRLIKDKDMRSTLMAHATLQFFYHIAPLYIPLYLHTVLGIPWDQLGWMFALMLLPFVLLEYPAGWLADKKIGDKELLLAGFILMGTSFGALAFVTKDTMILTIVILLVLNRAGAALVEAMSEGHFFRRVSESDASTVTVFRMMRPSAALVAPIICSLILAVASYGALFVISGIMIVVIGLLAGQRITDIR